VDIEEGFREAVRGFQAFQFVVKEEDGWVKRLRDDSLAQSRLNRAVKSSPRGGSFILRNPPLPPVDGGRTRTASRPLRAQ
jgi:hypothetical protein